MAMKVGIIGAGGIAQYAHIPGYQMVPDVEVVALSDPDTPRARHAARKFSIPHVFSNYQDLLKLGLDAVSVCAPNYLHAEATIAALEAGAHVLCEKPMAMNAAQAEKMVAASRRTGKLLMMAYNNRFRREAQALKKLIVAGMLGDVYFARAAWIRRRGIPSPGSWFGIKAQSGGGPLIDLGVHVLDLALWLMAEKQAATVMGATYAKFGNRPEALGSNWAWGEPVAGGRFDVEDMACAMIRFSDGASMFLEASWAANIEREQISIHLMGDKGGAQLGGSCDSAKVFTENHGVAQDINLVIPEPP